MIDKYINEKITEAAQNAVREIYSSIEIFPELPAIANTAEMANELRVSVEVLRRMAEDGMPHAHAGRELRFIKPMVIEWATSGRLFECETCGHRTPVQLEPAQTNVHAIGEKATSRLAEMAKRKIK